jgi:hypothetical protein
MTKKMVVWTNGKSIRKYVGQDKNKAVVHSSSDKGWYKAIALITPVTEGEK